MMQQRANKTPTVTRIDAEDLRESEARAREQRSNMNERGSFALRRVSGITRDGAYRSNKRIVIAVAGGMQTETKRTLAFSEATLLPPGAPSGRRLRVVGSRGGWQDLDIAACIPEATGLISSHDNVPRNADSPPLSSIAWREYLCRVACGVRQLHRCVSKERRSHWTIFLRIFAIP